MLPVFSLGTPLTLKDIIPLKAFAQQRSAWLPSICALRNAHRMDLSAHASISFETKTLVWWQVQEMLRIENIDHPQEIQQELAVYNALVPRGDNWPFTLFLEFSDPVQRGLELQRLMGVEKQVYLKGGNGFFLQASSIFQGEDKTAKASAVNFLKWDFPTPLPVPFPCSMSIAIPPLGVSCPLSPQLYEKLCEKLLENLQCPTVNPEKH